jgi:hypothetical protein
MVRIWSDDETVRGRSVCKTMGIIMFDREINSQTNSRYISQACHVFHQVTLPKALSAITLPYEILGTGRYSLVIVKVQLYTNMRDQQHREETSVKSSFRTPSPVRSICLQILDIHNFLFLRLH